MTITASAVFRHTQEFTPERTRRSLMLRRTTALATLTLLLVLGQALPDEEPSGLNDEGFITTWLLLAPIPLENSQSGADALKKEQLPKEAQLQPKAGDKVKSGSAELVWKK